MTGYEPLFGVPAYGDMPIYLAPLFLLELLWVVGIGAYFVTHRRREQRGLGRAIAGWGTLVILTALSSHAAFRPVPPRLIYPAVALILLGSVTAPAAGTLVGGFFRKRDSVALSIVTLSALLIIYGTGRGAGMSYEGALRGQCAGNLRLMHNALERYQAEHGDYPKQTHWMIAIKPYVKGGRVPICRSAVVALPTRAGVKWRIPVQIYHYHYVSWREAEDEDILVTCYHAPGNYLGAETLGITVAGRIVRK